MADSEHDLWIKKTFGFDPKMLQARGEKEIGAGVAEINRGAADRDRANAMIADGALHEKAAKRDLTGAYQDKAVKDAQAKEAAGGGLRVQAHGEIIDGGSKVLKGQEDVELAQVAENSFTAHKHHGKEINTFLLVVKDYYNNVLTGGNAKVTFYGGQGIPDTTINMAINNDGVARFKDYPMVIAANGAVAIEVTPPQWLAKLIPDGVLKTTTGYKLKPDDKQLGMEVTQGHRELIKSVSKALADAKTHTKGESKSDSSTNSHEIGGEAAAEDVLIGKAGGHYNFQHQRTKGTVTQDDLATQHSETNTTGSQMNVNQPLFDLTAKQYWI